jgi:phosphate:Na+ symporter
MTAILLGILGGVGLFLLGMILLTDGLKGFAGDGLREALVKFTGTPLKAFTSGTIVTLLVQSSSATTVTVIGFVSAGLLTFPQALGVVFGASLGTTGTGWIVSVLGLKVSLGAYALPVVGLGAFMKLLGRGKWQALGVALAGFGLIFLGIDHLQQGMEAFSARFNLASLPSTGLGGHLLAMGVGVLLTMILQSSSAAVATTLTALHSGAVNFEQAASLVIGAAIGTTVTALLASIGASVPAKRTAFAFVIFNTATGLVAILLLPVFLWILGIAQKFAGLEPGAVSLAAFHTLFIAMGVAMFLPWVKTFASLIEKLLPEKGLHLTRHLDRSLFSSPGVALETCRRTLREATRDIVRHLLHTLTPSSEKPPGTSKQELGPALIRVRDFLAAIPAQSDDKPLSDLRVSLFHAVDHLLRLQSRLDPDPTALAVLRDETMRRETGCIRELLELADADLLSEEMKTASGESSATSANPPGEEVPANLESIARFSHAMADMRRTGREEILAGVPVGEDRGAQALKILDALRWLDRIGYHTWRAMDHLGGTADKSIAEIEESASYE